MSPDSANSPHSGRRERRRTAFLEHGLSVFAEHEMLEILLYYAIPRGDTNETAHELISEFGSLAGVFDAPIEELKRVKGIGEQAAILIKLIPEISERYNISKTSNNRVTIHSPETAVDFLRSFFISKQEENVYAVSLDASLRVIKCDRISEGGIEAANVDIRKIVELAINRKASGLLLAHNHPSGNATPSREDIDLTKKVKEALKTIGVTLTDHIILAGSNALSMTDKGLV